MSRHCRCLNCITPPHLLKKLLESKDADVRQAALNTLIATARLRGERAVRGLLAAAAPGNGRRTVFDLHHGTFLSSATTVRTEDGPLASDPSANRAFDGLGKTRDFYDKILGRNSIDDHGMRLDGYVHRGRKYNNAFWDGQHMVFGDGDGVIFTDFTGSLDVIAHELTHGVTEFAAGLEYHNQSGALNESVSDVFGSVVKQWTLKQTADRADWLIGADIFTPSIGADALRSLKAPGTAYNNPTMGKDPQPAHMRNYVELADTEDEDFGGVHINSGIPNKAFFLTATGIGGYSWEAPAHIWYESLKASSPNTQFKEFAETTYAKAGLLYGGGSLQQRAVLAAWGEVGIEISKAGGGSGKDESKDSGKEGDSLAALTDEIEKLSTHIQELTAEIAALKKSK
jgi:Zn-dependent metalloprotease